MIAELSLDLNVFRFMAILGRVGGFVIAAPVFGSHLLPLRVRGVLVLVCTVAMLPAVPPGWGVPAPEGAPVGLPALVLLIAGELIIGLVAGLALRILVETFSLSGEFIGLFMGLMRMRLVNPGTQTSTTIMAVIMTQFFTILFLIAGGHHAVLRLAAESFQALPPGALVLNAESKNLILQAMNNMYHVGLKLAMPVLTMILFINLCMALMTKFGQEFNVLILSFPFRFGMGFFIIAVTLPVFAQVADKQMAYMFNGIRTLLVGG